MTLRKTIYGSDQVTRGNILDEVASFKEGKRQALEKSLNDRNERTKDDKRKHT